MSTTQPPPLNTPLGRSTYSIQKQSSFNLDIREDAERGVAYQKGIIESSSIGATAQDAFQSTAAAITGEPKLSAKEANERYGINGVIQFEEPIPASLAEARRDRALQARERDEILAAESVDNTGWQNFSVGASLMAGALTDPLTFVNVAGPAANLIKGAAAMKAFDKAVALRGALVGTAEILGSQAPKSPLLAGAVRGALDVGVPNTLTEVALYNTALNNGYDYDASNAMLAIGIGTGIGAGLGAAFTKIGTDITARNASRLSDNFFQKAFSADIVNKDIVDNLVLKHTSDLMDGKITSPELSTAILRLSDQSDEVRKFVGNLQEGKYGAVIDERTGKMIKLDDVSSFRKAGGEFKAFVMNSIDSTLGSNRLFKALVNSSDITARYGNLDSVSKINKVIDDLTRRTTEKLTESLTSPAAKALRAEADDLIRQADELRGFKADKISGKLDDLINNTELKDYTKLPFDDFLKDYKALKNTLRDRKIKDVNNFLGLSEASQKDIYKLYSMLGEDLNTNRSLEDLFKLDELELSTKYEAGIYKSGIQTMTRDQAYQVIKDELLGGEIKIRQSAQELVNRIEREINTYKDISESTVEDLNKELQAKIDQGFIESPTLKEEFKKLDAEYDSIIGKEKGDQEALNCIMRSLANG